MLDVSIECFIGLSKLHNKLGHLDSAYFYITNAINLVNKNGFNMYKKNCYNTMYQYNDSLLLNSDTMWVNKYMDRKNTIRLSDSLSLINMQNIESHLRITQFENKLHNYYEIICA